MPAKNAILYYNCCQIHGCGQMSWLHVS